MLLWFNSSLPVICECDLSSSSSLILRTHSSIRHFSAWLGQRDISRLTEKEIDAYISGGKKKGDLLKGYETAQDPKEWITDKEDAAALEKQREAEMAAMDEDDQLASENDAPATKGGKGKKDATKKRKRESAAATNGKKDEKKKPKKDTTKTKVSLRLHFSHTRFFRLTPTFLFWYVRLEQRRITLMMRTNLLARSPRLVSTSSSSIGKNVTH